MPEECVAFNCSNAKSGILGLFYIMVSAAPKSPFPPLPCHDLLALVVLVPVYCPQATSAVFSVVAGHFVLTLRRMAVAGRLQVQIDTHRETKGCVLLEGDKASRANSFITMDNKGFENPLLDIEVRATPYHASIHQSLHPSPSPPPPPPSPLDCDCFSASQVRPF